MCVAPASGVRLYSCAHGAPPDPHHLLRALRLFRPRGPCWAEDLLHDYQHVIESLTLVTGSSGVFDVEVDGETLYSKKATGRHADPGEVLQLFREQHRSRRHRLRTLSLGVSRRRTSPASR